MISIIIPVYNCEKQISRCVESILRQTYKNIECIIVDDGSVDGTAQICDELAEKDNRIKVIHISNGGVQAARERGVVHCRGDYIMFVDADDYIEDSICETALAELQKLHVNVVCFNYTVNGKKGFDIREREVIDSKTAIEYMLILKKLDGNLWGKLYKADLVKSVKFELKMHCNFITCAEILDRAQKVAVVPVNGYFYSITTNSITHYEKKCDARIVEYEKTSFAFYERLKRENPDLEMAAEYFWLKSLLWINIKIEKDSSLERGEGWANQEKKLLRGNAGRFIRNPYFGLEDKVHLFLCCFNLFRLIYHVLFYKRKRRV